MACLPIQLRPIVAQASRLVEETGDAGHHFSAGGWGLAITCQVMVTGARAFILAVDTLSEQTLSAIKLGAQQLADVVTLPARQRYTRFVQQVAASGEAWGLYRDGWALAKTDDGTLVFAMWPASEFADLCAEYEWDGYEPQAFSLDDLMSDLLPQLEEDEVLPGIFYTPGDRGLTPTATTLRVDLERELSRR
jgi:Protein of unknown function (DUF2750)